MEEGRQRGMGGEGRKLYVRKRTSSGLKRERGEGSRDESTKYAESTYSVPSPGLGVDTHGPLFTITAQGVLSSPLQMGKEVIKTLRDALPRKDFRAHLKFIL